MAITTIRRKRSVNVFRIRREAFPLLLRRWMNVNHAVVKAGAK